MLALRVVFGMSILLLPAGLAVRLAERRWSAGERHAVWTVALVLSLLLPILLRFEPPVAVFTGQALEVQRMSITVGPAGRAVDYYGAARFVWLMGMAEGEHSIEVFKPGYARLIVGSRWMAGRGGR